MTYKPVDSAIIMIVGPLIDNTDFKSLEEAVAYNAAGMDVSLIIEKTDGTSTVTAITLTTGGSSDWTGKDGGYYEIEVTAAQNAEEGIGYIRGVCDGVLPFESIHYNIVKANIYDSWVKGTDILQSDVTQLGGVTQSATDLKDFADTGYDPATNKIEGCKVNDDMVGTAGAYTGTPPTVGDIRTEMEGVGSKILAIEGDTNELQTDWKNTGRLDALLDAIPTTAMRGTDGANTTTPPTVIEIRQEMDTNSADLNSILEDTNELQTDWANGGRLDLILDRLLDVMEIKHGLSVAAAGATTTKFISNLTEIKDGYWNRMAVLFTSGNANGQMRRIKDYNGITKEITMQTPLDTAPANGDTFVIPVVRAFITPDIEDIADAVLDELIADHIIIGSLSKTITDTLEDTADLQGNQGAWTTATGFAPLNEYDTEMARIDTTVSSRSSHDAASIWAVTTRSLTDKLGFALSTSGIKAIWDQAVNVLTTVGSISKYIIDNLNATITSRSPSSEYDTEMARLDATISSRNAIAPNIVIPDVAGTAATLHGTTNGKIDDVNTIGVAIQAKTDNLPSGITKNEALPKFDFLMVLSSDHVSAAIEKTITGEISKDGGVFTAITNTITEVSSGMYTIANGFTQAEMNANIITLKFDAIDCDTRIISIITT